MLQNENDLTLDHLINFRIRNGFPRTEAMEMSGCFMEFSVYCSGKDHGDIIPDISSCEQRFIIRKADIAVCPVDGFLRINSIHVCIQSGHLANLLKGKSVTQKSVMEIQFPCRGIK